MWNKFKKTHIMLAAHFINDAPHIGQCERRHLLTSFASESSAMTEDM